MAKKFRHKGEKSHHDKKKNEYKKQLENWKNHVIELNELHDKNRRDWEDLVEKAKDTGEEVPDWIEPTPPILPHEPTEPDPPVTYTARKVTKPEEIPTEAYGTILVLPGRYILTDPQGREHSVSETEFNSMFSEEAE